MKFTMMLTAFFIMASSVISAQNYSSQIKFIYKHGGNPGESCSYPKQRTSVTTTKDYCVPSFLSHQGSVKAYTGMSGNECKAYYKIEITNQSQQKIYIGFNWSTDSSGGGVTLNPGSTWSDENSIPSDQEGVSFNIDQVKLVLNGADRDNYGVSQLKIPCGKSISNLLSELSRAKEQDEQEEQQVATNTNYQSSSQNNSSQNTSSQSDDFWGDSASSSSSSSSSSSTSTGSYQKSAVEKDFDANYTGNQYVRKYNTDGTTQAQQDAKRADLMSEQRRIQDRQRQQQRLENNIIAGNQQAVDQYSQMFAGDQLAMGAAQTIQTLATSFSTGVLDKSSLVTGGMNLLGGFVANAQRKREERERREAYEREQARIAAEKQAFIDKLAAARVVALNKLPEPEYPNSTTSSTLRTAFFYGLFYNDDNLKEGTAAMKVTEVFAVNQYSDGTWPFISKTQSTLKEFSSENPKLIGYFESYDAAFKSMSQLTTTLAENAVNIEFLNIADRFDTPLDDDFTGTETSGPTKDFWGNVVDAPKAEKKTKTSTKKKNTATKATDFWGETVPTKTIKIEAEKPKKKKTETKKKSTKKEDDDFWGTSVKVKKKKDN